MQKVLKTKIVFILVIIFLFFGIYPPAEAQVRDTDISISTSPEAPEPLGEVTVTISSFSVDLDKAQISWTLNGSQVLIGVGKKTFSFRVGDSGEVSTIDVFINMVGAPSINKRITIQPGEIDLLWEAIDSYVPPFYRGKALLSSEAQIKVIAMPNITTPSGDRLKDSDFTYTWKRNYDVDQGASGYGKRSFTFENNYLEAIENVSVSASSVLGNYAAEGKTIITPGNPKIVFYEKDPSFGINYVQSINKDFPLRKSALNIIAIPYFFSTSPDSSDLKYNWTINNSSTETPTVPNSLTIKVGEGSGNQAKIGLLISNLSKLFQTASKSATLNIEN